MARYAVQADSAKATVVTRLKLKTGPSQSSIGVNTTPTSGMEAFHIRFMPAGKSM